MPSDFDPCHRLAPLGLLALLGLACVGSGAELSADADSIGESGLATQSGSDSTGSAETETSESETETGSAETESGSGSSSTETSATETGATETGATETETGMDGPIADLTVLAIVDVNPNSATFDQKVHAVDYQGQLSAWYFGHAT